MLLEFWGNLTPLCTQAGLEWVNLASLCTQAVLEWVNLTSLCTQVVLEWVNLTPLCTQRCWSESIWHHFLLFDPMLRHFCTLFHQATTKTPYFKTPYFKTPTKRNDLPSKAFFETKQKKIWLYPWFLTAKLHSKRRFTSPNTLWKTYSELCSFSAESYSSESRPCCDPKLPKLLKLPSSGLPNTSKPHLPTPPPSKSS